ncbi:AMP-binding protein [Aestuariibacter halophilus]|uniref:AMP-binding protein n=1 Tax=Fluctibacter halophilus TaxID=226011 RepID=A0ABS8G990_9ALTE|nr:AMP-binding protein [Aestuariibacter halophilus]MCC2617083.1 AMP-binding protein [Aestuariibacter halophilus]
MMITATNNSIALSDGRRQLTYGQLQDAVAERKSWLQEKGISTLGIALPNGIEWVLFDLACEQANLCCVPVPTFFSPQQRQHLQQQTAMDACLVGTDDPLWPATDSPFNGVALCTFTPSTPALMPRGTGKITFTSGSTGTPKGVCLSHQSQQQQALALASAAQHSNPVHLCLLPLATLLENIAGVYAPLSIGGQVIVPNDEERGFFGSQLVDLKGLLGCISRYQPTSLILVPELLHALVLATQQGWQPPTSLQFVAVGGGKVSTQLLLAATQAGIPVYQGYGLSECCSVVTLNTPAQNTPGSVGPLLGCHSLRIEDDELVLSGNLFLGYLGEPDSWYPKEVYTGDLVSLHNGNLTIKGRRKNQLINSFGRNLSPEWVEAEIIATGLFKQVVVFGEAKPYCVALLYPASPLVTEQQMSAAIDSVNRQLPDYAQVQRWHVLKHPLTSDAGLLTDNMRPRRSSIQAAYSDTIEALYALSHFPQQEHRHVVVSTS